MTLLFELFSPFAFVSELKIHVFSYLWGFMCNRSITLVKITKASEGCVHRNITHRVPPLARTIIFMCDQRLPLNGFIEF